MEQLKCSKCNEFKSLDMFSKRKEIKRGYKSWCKDCICMKNHNRKYLGKNGEFKYKSTEFENGTKLCTICNNIKDINEFRTKDKRRNTLISFCHKCHSRKLKAKEYNIPFDLFDKLLEQQNHLCKICKGTNPDGRELYIDHDHNTGKVRGLLCNHCNTGLGKFKDNILILEEAIRYLKENY